MHRTLIVARMDPADSDAVAEIFRDSDATELPELIGIRARSLFRFNGLYFHLTEADGDPTERLYAHREHPLFQDVNTRLAKYMSPYLPSWREPKDSMAEQFYLWEGK
ncbi:MULTISPECIES: TcmI family type II polyketide cyclase [unclassified Nonomuraea]|uniref:TcmI family type II polyketide cyclase n=1 Tax=unclassified Nonomuraea TaxID=2593643 RepID=UPI003425F1CD